MSDRRKIKILIVEENDKTASVISSAVEQAGYEPVILQVPGEIPSHVAGAGLVMVDTVCAASLNELAPVLKNIPVVYITGNSAGNTSFAPGVPGYGIVARDSGAHIISTAVGMALRLCESENKFFGKIKEYLEIFNSSSDAIFVHDNMTGAIVDVNQTMLKMYGYSSREEVQKLTIEELSAADEGYDSATAMRVMREALESGQCRFEWRAKKSNGQVFWAEVVLQNVKIGNKTRIVASVRDISKRKEIEAELKKTEDGLQKERRFTQLLLDTSTAFIVAIDLNGKIIMMNRALLDFSGYSMDELIGADYLSYMAPGEDHEKISAVFRKIIQGKKATVNENRIMSRNGSIRLVEWHGQLVNFTDSGGSFFVGVGIDITDRKRAEEEILAKNEELTAMNEEMEAANEELIAVNYELQVAEERYRGVVETQSEMIARFTEDGTLTFANRAWRNYYREHMGFSEDVVGSKINDLMQIKNYDQVVSYLRTLKPGEMSASMERGFVSVSGESRWQLWNIQKHFDERRNLVEYQVVGNDITERKAAEAALRASEERLRSIIELAPDAIFTGDHEGIIIGVNQRASELTGYSRDELLGISINILFSEEERVRVPLRYDLLKAGHVVSNERILTRKDGGTIFIEMNTKMMPDGTYQTFMRDMTERKNSEKSISDEKERLSVTLRSIADGVITTDTDGRVVIMNRVAEELTGWQQEEAEGLELESVFTILNEFTRNPCNNPVRYVLETGRASELPGHTLLVARDGAERVITYTGAPIRDRKSVIIGVVLVFRDMTETRRLMDAVQQTDKLNSLGVLAGGIAHDFNNLLSGIFGYIEMARLKSANDKVVTGYLDKAFTVFNRARDLTQQLLTFSKGGTPVRKTGDISALLKESTSFALSGSNIICDYDISTDLKLCDFDENQMGQVIDNIVINAKQAMPLGGRISISACNFDNSLKVHPVLQADEYIQISITDTGIGIPPEMISRIYDPFFTTKQQGNGLGLATSYSIIRNHDGYIEAESTPGAGTTFRIYLPVSHKDVDIHMQNVQVEHTGSGKILIMDDEDFIRDIASDLLSGMGYTVSCAADGVEAIMLCREAASAGEPFAAAFFDLTIPGGMGGRETIEEVRRVCPEMPVFASSGFSGDHIMSHPADYGFTASIRKPYRRNELAVLLERYLKK